MNACRYRESEVDASPRLEREVWISQFRTELERLRPHLLDAYLCSLAASAWQNGGRLEPRMIATVVADIV